MPGWLAVPRDWLASLGDIARFSGRVMAIVYSGRVMRFFGEALRQAGILILGSTIVIWGLVFILGLQCGIEGAYFNRSVGAPAYAGVFAAWCDLREVIPYAFGYMMAAKVGTGIVAELGAMRISDEIDALEVMGVNPMIFLCGTRLLGAWMTLPFMYLAAIGVGYLASYLAVVEQIGEVSSGGYFLIFWMFQNPPDLIFSVIKAMFMATAIVLVGCYYGYTASGGPVGVGTATAKSMVLNIVLVHIIGMMGTLDLLGREPEGAHRWLVEKRGTMADEREQVDEPGIEEDLAERAARRSAARIRLRPLRRRGRYATPTTSRPRSWAACTRTTRSPASIRREPNPYRWHTGEKRDHGGEDAIEIIDVVKQFGRTRILNGLNLGLPDNQISMVLGPSGTGKSVLIKHIVGLLYPDSGDVLVHGESVPNMTDDELFEMRKKFGLLFQDGALFGSMNVFDNIAFPLRQHTDKGEDEIGEICNRRLREVGLAEAMEKMPNELSGGMRKRAGFARALVLDPAIVMFDEPDSGLDPVRTALLCELIREVHEENGGCYMVISHDLGTARRIADFIAVLWKGKIVESGPSEELFNSDNEFVSQFLNAETHGPLAMD